MSLTINSTSTNTITYILTTTKYDPSMGHIYSIPVAITNIIMSTFGVLGNLLIIIAIITTKELRNRCQFLIAYLALADLITSIYFCSIRIFIFNYMYYMSNYQCFLYSFYGLFALNIQTGLTAVLGFDRLLAVAAPYRYRAWNPKKYIIISIIPPNIYAIIITGYGYVDADPNKIVPVCMTPTAYNDNSSNLWVFSNGVIVLLVLLVYISANIIFRKFHNGIHVNSSSQSVKHVLTSLTIVMLAFACTWAFTILMLLVIAVWLKGTESETILHLFLTYPVIINTSSSVIIYAWRSADMRRAFIRILGFRKVLKRLQKVDPFVKDQIPTIMTTQTRILRSVNSLSIPAAIREGSTLYH